MKIKHGLAALAVVVGLLAAGGPAAAEDVLCLHRDDFRTVERASLTDSPMSRWQVHQLFGMTGRDIGYDTRVYQGCGDDSRAWIQYVPDAGGIYRAVSTAFTWRYFGDGLTTLQPA